MVYSCGRTPDRIGTRGAEQRGIGGDHRAAFVAHRPSVGGCAGVWSTTVGRTVSLEEEIRCGQPFSTSSLGFTSLLVPSPNVLTVSQRRVAVQALTLPSGNSLIERFYRAIPAESRYGGEAGSIPLTALGKTSRTATLTASHESGTLFSTARDVIVVTPRVLRGYLTPTRSCGAHPVILDLVVRRFFCDDDICSATTFAEKIPGLTQRWARRTTVLTTMIEAIGLAMAGRTEHASPPNPGYTSAGTRCCVPCGRSWIGRSSHTDPGDRRLRTAPWPRLRKRHSGSGHGPTDRSAARPNQRHSCHLASCISRCRDRVPRPGGDRDEAGATQKPSVSEYRMRCRSPTDGTCGWA